MRDLEDTLNEHPEGIGLAARQIDVHSRVVVIRLGNKQDSKRAPDAPLSLINSEIMEARNEQRDLDGCFSFPILCDETIPHYLKVAGLDKTGRPFNRVFKGIDAVLVHQELVRESVDI